MEGRHGTLLLLHLPKCRSPEPEPVSLAGGRVQARGQRRSHGRHVPVQPGCPRGRGGHGGPSGPGPGQHPRSGHDTVNLQTRASVCGQAEVANVRQEAGKWNRQS